MKKKIEDSLVLSRNESIRTSSETGDGLTKEALISAHNAIQRLKRRHAIDLTGVACSKVVLFQSQAEETNEGLIKEALISAHNAIQRSMHARS